MEPGRPPPKRISNHKQQQQPPRTWHTLWASFLFSLTAARKVPLRALACWSLVLAACLVVINLLAGSSSDSSLLHFLRSGGSTLGSAAARRRPDLPMLHKAQNYVSYDCGKACAKSNLLILQTSDGRPTSSYSRMLDTLQGTSLAYAAQWGFHYLRWDGLAKGRQAWHATYNRIYLLHALHQQGRFDWVLFLDPDAVLRDPRLSVEDLLDERYAVLGCQGGDDPTHFWDINIGVAFFNLRHREFGSVIKGWMAAIDKVASWTLERGGGTNAYVAMGQGPRVKDDQQMFQDMILKHPKGKTLVKRFFGGDDAFLFNYNKGKYVAHLIRADNRQQDARFLELLQLKAGFSKTLGEIEEERVDAARRAFELKRKKEKKEEKEASAARLRQQQEEQQQKEESP